MLFTSPISLLELFVLALQAIPQAASATPQVAFDQFLATVTAADFQRWQHTAVNSESSLDQMKAHIFDMYSGVGSISHSFVLDNRYFDCIDIEKQPSLGGRPLASPPSAETKEPPNAPGGPTVADKQRQQI